MNWRASQSAHQTLPVRPGKPGERAALITELCVAIAIFSLIVLAAAAPLTMDQSMVRQQTARAVAMQIVDGEMEVLAAGAWRAYREGEHEYPVTSEAAKTLPKGRFVLLVDDQKVRLEWRTNRRAGGESARVVREFRRQP